MKAKINIEIWDSTTPEKFDKSGFTNDIVKNLYEVAFKNILNEMMASGTNYSLDVEVTDEVN